MHMVTQRIKEHLINHPASAFKPPFPIPVGPAVEIGPAQKSIPYRESDEQGGRPAVHQAATNAHVERGADGPTDSDQLNYHRGHAVSFLSRPPVKGPQVEWIIVCTVSRLQSSFGMISGDPNRRDLPNRAAILGSGRDALVVGARRGRFLFVQAARGPRGEVHPGGRHRTCFVPALMAQMTPAGPGEFVENQVGTCESQSISLEGTFVVMRGTIRPFVVLL